jgi:hypothetical protein
MIVAALWNGREHASRRCAMRCQPWQKIRIMLRNVWVSLVLCVPSVVLIISQHYASKKSSRACQDEPSYSKSASSLLPAARTGAGGVLKGFRRLDPKNGLSNVMHGDETMHLSPAAADGNELNMSGCFGVGVSLQYALIKEHCM